jgi:demethoxyubiquinone hydroxylase (CLK1/Coq7/Cat5 family)
MRSWTSFATNDERRAKRVSDALGTATEMRAMKNYAGHRLTTCSFSKARRASRNPVLARFWRAAAKEVAQVASAFGREFSSALVAATLGRSEDELESELDQLRSIDVIFQSSRAPRRYTFKHALLQEAGRPRGGE